MAESFEGEVLHVVAPDELDEQDLAPALRERADSRYLLVCREGGEAGWLERVVTFLRGGTIEAVTVVVDEDVGADVAEGDHVHLSVEPTELAGVYDATTRDASDD